MAKSKKDRKVDDFWLSGMKDLAGYVGFSIKTCQKMIKIGLPKHTSPLSGRPMFKPSEIDSWIRNRKKI